ncbi:MAG: response regulator [Verrucomicrobiota bacterium]
MNTPQRRILIVDDHAAIHQDFQKIFEAPSRDDARLASAESVLFGTPNPNPFARPVFKIDSAYQGLDAVEMVRQSIAEESPYAVAFVDVRMPPGLDGIETAARLWTVYPDLQIVICTAYSDYSLDEIIEQLGHSDRFVILKKPFDNIEVLQLAIALTRKWELLQHARCKMNDLENCVQERTRELKTANRQLHQEIEQRQRDAEVLSATRERLGHLLASSPAVTYSFKVHDQILVPSWVSENIRELLGYSVEEWCQPDWEAKHLKTAEPIAAAGDLKTLFERGQSSQEQSLRMKDGSIRWVRNERRLLRDPEGRPTQVVGAYTDVTERRQLEDQLRQAQKMEAIGQLAGGVAHDFNNLLTVIGGYTQMMLSEESLVARTKEALTRIIWATDRASDLTRRLLTYGRKQVLQPTQLDVGELVVDVSKMLRRLLGEHIALKTECAAAGLKLFADRTMMEQIIMNLAVNARDAMPGGGTLTIHTAAAEVSSEQVRGRIGVEPGRFVCLTLSDNGRGIPPEILPKIFEPFFTTKDVGQGTGLGLATVDGIVKAHHGWIEVESQVGRGTTFKIFLPASVPVPVAATPAPSSDTRIERRNETILLVEDEPALRRLSRTILEKRGHRVLEAASGVEALEVWKQHSQVIDLLFTDMVMPAGLTGGKLAMRLRSEKPALKVLFTSGYSTELLEDDCLLKSGMSFLPKPFNPQSLLTAVRHCLDGKPYPPPSVPRPEPTGTGQANLKVEERLAPA